MRKIVESQNCFGKPDLAFIFNFFYEISSLLSIGGLGPGGSVSWTLGDYLSFSRKKIRVLVRLM
jgi:hypothetical protein